MMQCQQHMQMVILEVVECQTNQRRSVECEAHGPVFLHKAAQSFFLSIRRQGAQVFMVKSVVNLGMHCLQGFAQSFPVKGSTQGGDPLERQHPGRVQFSHVKATPDGKGVLLDIDRGARLFKVVEEHTGLERSYGENLFNIGGQVHDDLGK